MSRKLAELSSESIDAAIQALCYNCNRQCEYLPHAMFCYGKPACCQISINDNYYFYNNSESSRFNLSVDQYTFCVKCFDSVESDSIFVGDDPAEPLIEIPKSFFSSAKNDIKEPEIMVDCIVCTRRWHQVCALHLDQIWPEGFICNICIREYNVKREENPHRASKLTVNDLSSQLEKRVNDFLRNENCQTGHVTIRVLSTSDKICQVKPELKNSYPNQLANNYPYRSKSIFAFQEIEGVDVVFFGMYVQEYDEHCPPPNTRRVYIPYIDTVHFFQPKIYRTDVYHQILIGYFDYVKQHGYMYAHIWAAPASEDIDYIFHRHPTEQRMLKSKRMNDWCKKMLDKAIVERVVINYKDILQDCLDNQVQTVLDIPYFHDDFWPFNIEENIQKLNQEEDRRNQELEAARSMADADYHDAVQSEICGKRKSANIYQTKNPKKTANCTDLLSRIFSTMEKYKESFFVIRLHDEIPSCPTVHNTNDLIPCDLMDMANVFLNFATNKNYEFSSLRRAKFSTMALLHELHTSTADECTYLCNTCRQQCHLRYHCTVCEDFDQCEKCYKNIELKHEHKMEQVQDQ